MVLVGKKKLLFTHTPQTACLPLNGASRHVSAYLTSLVFLKESKSPTMIPKITTVLKRAGFGRAFALIIASVISTKDKPFTSVDIQRISGLQQPQVSIGLKAMVKKGWIKVAETKRMEGINRPVNLYLASEHNEIILSIEAELKKKITETEQLITELRSAMIPEKPLPGEQKGI